MGGGLLIYRLLLFIHTAYSNAKVELMIPLRILLIPNDRSLPLLASKGHYTVRIHQLLLDCSNVQYLLDTLKIAGIHCTREKRKLASWQ